MDGDSLSASQPRTEPSDIGQPTILLVDDHPSIRMMLSSGLKTHGFHVLAVGTAEKALAYCEGFTGRIDLLLTDIGLTPQQLWAGEGSNDSILHGVALAERAVRTRPSLQVVLFTGYSDEQLKRLSKRTERFLLLRKPCGVATLVSAFQQLLEQNGHGNIPMPRKT
jgi:CheY-like chemotaxis protein